ncbi:MAG: FMN-binding glutamate synthase family protein [Rickettsiales bacterium]
MRIVFYIFSLLSLSFTYFLYQFWPAAIYLLYILIPVIIIGIYDVLSIKHTILRNYPVLGHFRYLLEYIRPEIQQYFIADDHSEKPYSREIRNIVYQRAKNVMDTVPFGTKQSVNRIGFEFLEQSLKPKFIPPEQTRVVIGGPQCKKPYSASILNISAMSFGALSYTAISALNKGAKLSKCYHNTGEGGVSPYHLSGGGDLVWQIGTAYFGCRTRDGKFDAKKFAAKTKNPVIKMIELKLSQGAKPSHGGILPKEKITSEISEIRGIPLGEDCDSPPSHSAFDTPIEMMRFVGELRKLSGGKPVGFKLAIGKPEEFMSICKAMLKTKIYPDFITVDGSEGGTGAAPLEFTNRLGKTINESLILVHSCLVGIGARDKIKIIASGKIATGFDLIAKLCIGADLCNCARTMMFALGCIQSLSCNTNKCPTGIATQNSFRARGLNIQDKSVRVSNYHRNTVKSFRELVGAIGINDINELSPSLLHRRETNSVSKNYLELYEFVTNKCFMNKKSKIPDAYKKFWNLASAEQF